VTLASGRSPSRLAPAAAVALALALAGCGESREEAGSTATTSATPAVPTASGADFTVVEREYSIDPHDLDVPKPGSFTLAIQNAGGVPHALEVEGRSGKVETGPIAPGKTAMLELTLTRPGRYEWYCPIDGHRGRGMRGTVIVAGGGKAAEPAAGKSKKSGRRDDSGGSTAPSGPTGGTPAPRGDSTYP
jgi:plastocyanin